jgi:hypothetical protein
VQRDHFDEEVEASLRRDLPLISTHHAKSCLEPKGFNRLFALDPFQEMMIDIKGDGKKGGTLPQTRVTGMPGEHVPTKPLQALNELLQAVSPPEPQVFTQEAMLI